MSVITAPGTALSISFTFASFRMSEFESAPTDEAGFSGADRGADRSDADWGAGAGADGSAPPCAGTAAL